MEDYSILGLKQYGLKQREIGFIYHRPQASISNRLKRYMPNKHRGIIVRCYDDFFDEIGPEQAWILGWISGDGHIPWTSNSFIIGLDGDDRGVLEFIQEFFPGSNLNKSRLEVTSLKIKTRLLEIGVPIGKKSKYVEPIDCGEYQSHFWRGLFEADGSIGISKRGYPYFSIVGTEKVCEGFRDYIGCTNKVSPMNGSFIFQKSVKNYDFFKNIYDLFYTDDVIKQNIFMRRKFATFCQVLEYLQP